MSQLPSCSTSRCSNLQTLCFINKGNLLSGPRNKTKPKQNSLQHPTPGEIVQLTRTNRLSRLPASQLHHEPLQKPQQHRFQTGSPAPKNFLPGECKLVVYVFRGMHACKPMLIPSSTSLLSRNTTPNASPTPPRAASSNRPRRKTLNKRHDQTNEATASPFGHDPPTSQEHQQPENQLPVRRQTPRRRPFPVQRLRVRRRRTKRNRGAQSALQLPQRPLQLLVKSRPD